MFYTTLKDESYPQLLSKIFDPPKKLFYKGKIETLKKTCIAVIGTREYSDYGEMMTEKIIEELAVLDIAIVSGLALGIDTIAHKAALKNNLPTIAVLGSGIDNLYPKQNTKLSQQIEQNGIVISEYEPTDPPEKFHFPARNRIISGLSIATIVIEAPIGSGALITARSALEQGREIFAVPGDCDRKNSTGIIEVLQNGGAYPISSGKDVIEVIKKQPHLFLPEEKEIPPQKINKNTPNPLLNLSPRQFKIISSMPVRRPKSFEEIQKRVPLQTHELLAEISMLEIDGFLTQKDGKYIRIY